VLKAVKVMSPYCCYF